MENPLFAHLNQTGRYSEHDLLLLECELQSINIPKNETILNKGEVCSSIYFVIKGAVIHYHTDEELDETIIDLNGPNDWVVNHKSFATRKPSEYEIKSYEDSSLYRLSIESIHKLIAQSQAFLQMGKILEESTSRVEFFDHNYTPDEKYQYLVAHSAHLIQSFPQKLIASYLKITPETLSRVRSRFSRT